MGLYSQCIFFQWAFGHYIQWISTFHLDIANLLRFVQRMSVFYFRYWNLTFTFTVSAQNAVSSQSNYKCHWTYSAKYSALYQYTHGFWTNISVLKLRIILVLSNSDSTFHQIQTLQLKKHQFGMDSCLNGLNLTKQNNWSNCVNYANQADDAKEMQCTLFILQIIMIESDWLLLHCEICTCVSQPLICIVWYFSSWKTEQTN